MTSDVVLSAALRSNLLSLQGTQKGIDNAQFKLSTGKKVNSALDNPQSFFAAQALTNRASDLTKLLDGIGQSIQVIKAADNGITALTTLVNQAQAIATSAQDALSAAATAPVTLTGSTNVSTLTDLTSVTTGYTNGDQLDFTSIDSSGNKLTRTVTVNTGDSAQVFAAKITAAFANTGGQVTATLNTTGNLVITAASGYNLRVDNYRNAAGTVQAFAAARVTGLGLGAYFAAAGEMTSGTARVAGTFTSGSVVRSNALTTTTGAIATGATRLSDLAGFGGLGAATDDFYYGTNAANTTIDLWTGGVVGVTNLTVQGFVDGLNANTVTTGLTAAFDATSGRISLTAATTATYVIVGQNAGGFTTAFGFGSGKTDADLGATQNLETIAVSNVAAASTATITSLQTQYNSIRTQIDQLVSNGDTSYRGTNLLNGNNLVTNFNELRTSTLTTRGATYNSSGLGLGAANFSTAATISTNLSQVTSALTSLRNFGSNLATDLATIQSRQDFTSGLINTLKTGSDLLVNADQNEEGAKLLALQTRQSLGVTALSLASQSQQSILRLFG